jgi:MFS family permease
MFLGIPAARLADVWSRRKVIALAIGTWSVMTALCGAANNFVQLLFARMGVGVGEAGGSAPCQAFVSDLFPRNQRATAMAIYLLSVPIGLASGMAFGGWAVEHFNWRWTFVLAGIPGLIVAPLILLTIPEVPKGVNDGGADDAPPPPYFQTVRLLLATPSFRYTMLGSMFHGILTLGTTAWVPSFLARSHHMAPASIGFNLALMFAIPHALGVIAGGRLADVMGRRDPAWYMRLPSITTPLGAAFSACVFLAPTEYVFWFMAPANFFLTFLAGTSQVVGQTLAPPAFRASATAFMLFVINMVAVGLGPQFVGIASDLLRPTYGEESLRIALLFATSVSIIAGTLFYLSSRTYKADLAVADARNKA